MPQIKLGLRLGGSGVKCLQCQAQNRDGARFCRECGAILETACSSCGAQVEARSKFCDNCGASLAVSSASAAIPVRFASPESYTPKHLAEKVLTSKAALEGERKRVTVLFADLKGSMELLADRDPEEARKILDPVLERMMEAVHRYEGTVNQIMGDGIMALFGAPIAHEEHAVRACYAALRMQESVGRYAEEMDPTLGLPVHIRVGLNSGEVVVRAIGSDLRMDYTAVGQTTHLAARMEQMAMPGSILITAETLRLAEGYLQVKPIGPLHVKGLNDPVEVYEVTGAGRVRTRFQTAGRALTPFVGREEELQALHHVMQRAGAGHGQVVGVLGEPGVGKTRLFYEFTQSHRTQAWLLLETSATSYGKATAYLPVIELLKAYFQVEDRDDDRQIREKVTGKLLTLDASMQPTLGAFLTLLDVPVEDQHWQTLDPPQRRQRTLDALKRLVLRESQVQPVCLVVENLHWIDSETQALLDSLVESLPTARLLLLVNYRPEYEHGWGSKTYYTQLRLDPLLPENAEELLRSDVGSDTSLQPLKRLLIERTEGNPFFLEESVRTLVETSVLIGDPGAYSLSKALPSIQVPTTVQAVLAARIDRLPPREKSLLQSASVIGTRVPFPLLQAIAELPEEALRQDLIHLQAAEFLYETNLFPDLEYTFKHALTHEVAYESLLQTRRRSLHARIMEVIEDLYADRLAEQIDRLAHHAFRGEVWDKAFPYLRQAGAKAFARRAYPEAKLCFEQALVALKHLPEGRDTLEEAIDVRFDLRQSLIALGELAEIVDHLRVARELAEALDDQRRLGRVCFYAGHLSWAMGQYDRAVEAGQRALAVAGTDGDHALQISTNFFLGQAYHSLGDYRQAIKFEKRNVEVLKGDLIRERFLLFGLPSAMSRTWLAWSLAELGEFAEGIIHGEEAIRIAEALDHPFSRVIGSWGLGGLYLRRGEFHQTVSILERALELWEADPLPFPIPWTTSCLGYAYALSGRIAEALPLLEQAVEQASSMRLMAFHSLSIAQLSEAYLLAGRVNDASDLAERALSLGRDRNERGNQAWTLRLLGEIAARRERPDIATVETYYRQALTLAEEMEMRPLVAHCHAGLGTLFRRAGKAAPAEDHLTTAIGMFDAMDMQSWRERMDRERLGRTTWKERNQML